MLAAQMKPHLRNLGSLAVGLAFVLSANTAFSYDGKPAAMTANEVPEQMKGVGIDEQLGKTLDLSMTFKNEDGQTVTLGSFFDGKTPVIISPVYYSCPGLCNFHLNGFTDGLKQLDWNVGEKFKLLAISFDSKEGPDLAQKKKETYIKLYDRPDKVAQTTAGWHFLTTDEPTVQAFLKAVGFKLRWDETQKDWVHASAAIVVSPQGELTRYLPGIVFDAKDIKLAVNEASEGKVGSFVDSLLLYCFKYDPHQSKYTLYAFNLVKVGAALMVLLLALWLLPVWMRTRREAGGAARR